MPNFSFPEHPNHLPDVPVVEAAEISAAAPVDAGVTDSTAASFEQPSSLAEAPRITGADSSGVPTTPPEGYRDSAVAAEEQAADTQSIRPGSADVYRHPEPRIDVGMVAVRGVEPEDGAAGGDSSIRELPAEGEKEEDSSRTDLDKLPNQPNIELQELFLEQERKRFHAEMFEAGVISRLCSDSGVYNSVKADVEGIGQLDRLFVPSLSSASSTGEERRLSLVAITDTSSEDSRSSTFSHIRVGTVDNVGIVHPHPGVNSEDAYSVYEGALSLVRAKEQGLLPDLDDTLLGIDDWRTGITEG